MRRTTRWLLAGAALGAAIALWTTWRTGRSQALENLDDRQARAQDPGVRDDRGAGAAGSGQGRRAPAGRPALAPPRLQAAAVPVTIQNDPRAPDYDPRNLIRIGRKADDVIAAEPRLEPWATKREKRLASGIEADLSLAPGARLEGVECRASSCVVSVLAPVSSREQTQGALTMVSRGDSTSPRMQELGDGTDRHQLLVLFKPERQSEAAYESWYQKLRERQLSFLRRTPKCWPASTCRMSRPGDSARNLTVLALGCLGAWAAVTGLRSLVLSTSAGHAALEANASPTVTDPPVATGTERLRATLAALGTASSAAAAATVNPPRVPVPAELTPYQRTAVEQPTEMASLQNELGEVQAARREQAQACMRGLDVVGPVRLRCALQVQARGASAQADGLRCSDVLAGMPLPDPARACIESALGAPHEVRAPTRWPFPDEWAGEMPLEVVVMGSGRPLSPDQTSGPPQCSLTTFTTASTPSGLCSTWLA